MKWVKHMTASHDDEKLADLITRYGHAGYGVWWLVVEIVAARVESGDKAEVTYPVSKWSHLLSVRGSHVRQCLLKLEVTHLVTLEWNDTDITVRIPNVLKYRDEYSRKSGQTPDKLRSKNRTELEADKELDKEPPKPPAPNGAGSFVPAAEVIPSMKEALKKRKLPKQKIRTSEDIFADLGPERLVWWEKFWEVYPRGDSKKEALEWFEGHVKTHEFAVTVWRTAKRYAEDCAAHPHRDVSHAITWFNKERWIDDIKDLPSGNGNGHRKLTPTEVALQRALEEEKNAELGKSN